MESLDVVFILEDKRNWSVGAVPVAVGLINIFKEWKTKIKEWGVHQALKFPPLQEKRGDEEPEGEMANISWHRSH